jgi:hypothetical protein
VDVPREPVEPEFAGCVLDEWADRQGIRLRFIRPGKPVENAYIESFNGKFRDECGAFGNVQGLACADGGFSVSRAFVGVGDAWGGGAIVCKLTLICFSDPKCCGSH